LFILTDLNDEQAIALEDLRKVLYECPQKAKQYNYALIKGINSVQHKIRRYITEVKHEIEMLKIRRSALNKILSYKEETMQQISALFDADGKQPIVKLLKNLDDKCQSFVE
jgi:sugar-specific transcriptional regulator TrmB